MAYSCVLAFEQLQGRTLSFSFSLAVPSSFLDWMPLLCVVVYPLDGFICIWEFKDQKEALVSFLLGFWLLDAIAWSRRQQPCECHIRSSIR